MENLTNTSCHFCKRAYVTTILIDYINKPHYLKYIRGIIPCLPCRSLFRIPPQYFRSITSPNGGCRYRRLLWAAWYPISNIFSGWKYCPFTAIPGRVCFGTICRWRSSHCSFTIGWLRINWSHIFRLVSTGVFHHLKTANQGQQVFRISWLS